MEATAEIPNLQFAKVGKNRERKKGGLPLWLRGARPGGGFAGALGGEGLSGGASLIAQILPKFIMASMIVSMGVGVYGLKMAMGPQKAFHPAAAKPKKLFDSPSAAQKYSGDLSSLPGGGNQNQSGLSMIQGGLGDAASGQANAQGGAGAAGQGQGDKAGQDAAAQNGKDGKDDKAPAGTPDPAAIAAAAAAANGGAGPNGAGKNGPFSTRFGALSSGFGGGQSSPFASGGMFGGVGHAFDSGKLSGFGSQAQAGRTQAAATPTSHNPARRLAARQLNNAFAGGQNAQNQTTSAGASYSAAQPFDNGGQQNAQLQGPIGGATTPTGGAGAGAGNAGSPSGGGGGSTNPSGPTLGGAPANPMTDCVQMLGPDYSNSANGGCVQTTAGNDVTPWGGMVKMAGLMLVLASVLLMLAGLADYMGWWGKTVVKALAGIAAMLAGIVTVIGLAVMQMGQTAQGMMLTLAGGITTAASVMVYLNPEAGNWASETTAEKFAIISAAIGGAMGSVFGGMAASSGSTASSYQ